MDLRIILKHLNLDAVGDPNLLVGFETADDAGVYKLTPDIALVQTLDFITPLCDDPFVFGQIAAANFLSDVYAMGGRPINVMNICCFPSEGCEPSVLAEILRGGNDKVKETGAGTWRPCSQRSRIKIWTFGHRGGSSCRVLKKQHVQTWRQTCNHKKIGTGVIITAQKTICLHRKNFNRRLIQWPSSTKPHPNNAGSWCQRMYRYFRIRTLRSRVRNGAGQQS